MLIHTTCATCRAELAITLDAVNDESHRATHIDCAPAPKTQADSLFDNFRALVETIAAPDYKPKPHDELNLSALQDKIDQLDQAPPRLGAAALIYAQWGFPVFPLKPNTKVPVTPHGFKDASLDPDRIRGWWTNTNYNIGIATGHAFDVIDVDLPDGPASWREMAADPGAPDVHGIVSTASGGRHFLVTPKGIGNKARIRPGIDVRGRGGYVVAPPSWLGDHGHKWTWLVKPSPTITKAGA